LIGLVLVAVLVLAACGSSGKKSTSNTTTPAGGSSATASSTGASGPGTDVGLTSTQMNIGVIADVQTAVVPGLFQKNINLVKDWAAIVNSHGGLAGRQVVVDSCDSKLDPNAARNCVIQLCAKDFALVGTAALGLTNMADVDGCKNSAGDPIGIPNLAGIVFGLQQLCDPLTYSMNQDETYCQTINQHPQTYTVMTGDDKWLTQHFGGLHGIFLYDTDTPTAKNSQLPIYHGDSQFGGVGLDGEGFYGANGTAPQSALTPVVQVLKAHNSTFAQLGATPSTEILLRKEAQLQGVTSVKAWVCSAGCYTNYFIPTGGSAVNGTYQTLLTIPFYDQSEYSKNATLSGLIAQAGGPNNLDSNSLSSYLEALLFQDAVNKATANGGTLNRQSLLNVLKTKETAFNPDGIAGTTNVSGHLESPCFAMLQVVNGQWQRVYPTAPDSFDCNPSNLSQVKLDLSS
jgi:ABC-type branched-subunit amino acid transport system substrate-binding protein